MYSNAQYCGGSNGSPSNIRVDINGVTSFVPLDPANTDYQNLFRLQEEGKIVIAPASNEV
jgi:hypothetical protein